MRRWGRVCCWLVVTLLAVCSCREKTDVSVFDIIPRQTAIVLETENWNDLKLGLNRLSKRNGPFCVYDNGAQLVDSVLLLDGRCASAFEGSRVALSIGKQGAKYLPFIIVRLNRALTNKDLKRAFEASGRFWEVKNSGDVEFVVVDSMFVFAKDGFLSFSNEESMAVEIARQLGNPDKMDDSDDFKRVSTTLGTSVPSHIYLNYSLLEEFLTASSSSSFLKLVSHFSSQFKGLAALDVLLKDEGFVLNGYSKATDSVSCLKPLKYQLPVRNSIVDVLPSSTKLMLHYGMSDYASYWEEFADKQSVASMNARLGVDVKEDFVRYLSEVSYSVIGEHDSPVFVARMIDPAAMMQFWNRLVAKNGVSEIVTSQGYTLCNLNCSGLVPAVFGIAFEPIRGCCYSIIDQYLVVANDIETLQSVVASYRIGRTLDLDENFRKFQNNMLEKSNITLYITCEGNQRYLRSLMQAEVFDFVNWENALSGYQAFSVQLAASKDMVYTCAYLRRQLEKNDDKDVLWRMNLDAPLCGNPCFVPNAAANSNDLVVFDVENNMYLVNAEGRVIWKTSVLESPMSEVYVVDVLRDGRRQFVFNTENYLYRIDADGSCMDGFPRRLPVEASNGIALFEYVEVSGYQVVLCGKDRFVYNFDLMGNESEDWNRHRTEDIVAMPVQHLVADNKDFVVITDVNGGVRILDRQGRIRIPLVSGLEKSKTAAFYENKTNRKGVVLTSDKKGDLLYISMDGSLSRTDFGDFSDKHFFLYGDYDLDQVMDFIYLDQKDLWVFDRFKNILFERTFDAEIDTKPFFVKVSKNKQLLCIVSEKTHDIYLVDSKGNVSVNSGLVGDGTYAIGSFWNDSKVNLVIGRGSMLFNYSICNPIF